MQKSIINKHNPLEYYIIYTNCKKMQKDNLKLYNKNPAKMETSKSYICEFCAKIYSDAATLSRHRNHYCTLVPDDVKAKMIEKQQRRKRKHKSAEIPVDKSVNITNIQVLPDYENNGFGVYLEFTVVNLTQPVTINFFLERIR